MGLGVIAQLVAGALVGARASSQVVKQADSWFRLTLGLSGTALVTFLGVFGGTGGAAFTAATEKGLDPFACVALGVGAGLFTASAATAGAIYGIWRRSELTKGIPLFAPVKVAQDEMNASMVYLEPKKEK